MKANLWRILSAVLVSAIIGCGQEPRGKPKDAEKRRVDVAAAADLKFALDEVMDEFHKKRPGIEVRATYGSSGNFFAQLSSKAPFDLFLSADMDFPRKLVEKGLADKDTEFMYAIGHIVVWVPKTSSLDVEKQGMEALKEPAVRKIAIANPQHAPYGRAAEAALKKLGVYEAVKDKLVFGQNIAQTAQFVESGAADVGVIALSLALAPRLRDKGRFWEVPASAYPTLQQGGVILNWARDAGAARQFAEFMRQPAGRAILKRFGFFVPGD